MSDWVWIILILSVLFGDVVYLCIRSIAEAFRDYDR